MTHSQTIEEMVPVHPKIVNQKEYENVKERGDEVVHGL